MAMQIEVSFCRHGMVLNFSGTFLDQFSAFAGTTFDADMVTDNPGTWLFHCHVRVPVTASPVLPIPALCM